MTKIIRFDETRYIRLKKAYEKALTNKQEVFVFEGNEFYIEYAKYLLEYLGAKLEAKK